MITRIDQSPKNPAKRTSATKKRAQPLSIIDALDKVQEGAKDSQLTDKFWKNHEPEFSYLTSRLGLSNEEVLLVAVMCELGGGVSWRGLASFFGTSRLRTMTLTPEIDSLKAKRWIRTRCVFEKGNSYQGFGLVYGVVTAMRENRTYIPEKIDGLTEQQFVERLGLFMVGEGNDDDFEGHEKSRMILQLAEANPDLPICKKLAELDQTSSKVILLMVLGDYARYADTPTEGILFKQIMDWFDNPREGSDILDSIREEKNELFTENLVEFRCRDGMVDPDVIKLTSYARNLLLSEYSPKFNKTKRPRRDVVRFDAIKEKKLYFNDNDRQQVDRLSSLLATDKLSLIQERLKESGMRTGIACIFYGAPGTGKTETVLQLARESGRDVMQVDVSSMRDKFVGESEKNIRMLFSRYRNLCKECETTPILLFNEADAIFGNRFESVKSSVEKMDNAMQNIILEEMENLEGILIATTNLTCNLDKAFDRRFLFKVEFSRPDIDTRRSIWQSMMPELNAEDAKTLAREFDLSGGQIENIARKSRIESIITGSPVPLSQMRRFCREEHLNRSSHTRIGF